MSPAEHHAAAESELRWACGHLHHEHSRADAVYCLAHKDGGASAPPDFAETFTPLTAHDLCSEAARLVGGLRKTQHGDKLTNFACVADLWNGYWRAKCRTEPNQPIVTPFTPLDVANMMELLKVARRFTGTFNADDYIDAAGYAGCAGEVAGATSNAIKQP